jgi:hypothetical protein
VLPSYFSLRLHAPDSVSCNKDLSCEQNNNRTKLEKFIKKQGKKKNFVGREILKSRQPASHYQLSTKCLRRKMHIANVERRKSSSGIAKYKQSQLVGSPVGYLPLTFGGSQSAADNR